MTFIQWIIQGCINASDYFYDIYLEVYDWVWPFWYAARFFYYLSQVFADLSWDFTDFEDWLEWAEDELNTILSWSNIRSLIRSWLPDLEDVVDWFDQWWVWIGQEIEDWWNTVKSTVQDWIDIAKQFLQTQLDSLTSWLTSLQASWDNFKEKIPSLDEIILWFPNWWGNVLTSIIAWGALTATEIDTFIDSKIREWLPFIESLQELWDSVAEFITDPLEWLWTRFTDWFLGPEV